MSCSTPLPNFREGKRQIQIVPKKGETMDTCATISDKYICCNVKVLKSVSNCPFDCSYCFLQNYLNDGTTKIVGDTESLLNEVKQKIQAQPWRLFRIGTWELGDSLALEKESGQAKALIQEFATLPNAILELKTKSDQVDTLLNLDHQQKTVVSWSLNPEHIINTQEHKTARLHERLAAMKKVADHGYPVGFHVDPMIYYPEWKEGYTALLNQIFDHVKPEQLAWISVGSLRFNPEMKKKMEENFPATTLTLEEMVLGDDGKMRYVKPTRIQMYAHFLNELQKHLNLNDISPLSPPEKNLPLVYFCMERWDIWERFFGKSPTSIGHLDYLFAKSMQTRFNFPTLKEPNLELYTLFQKS